MSISKLIRWSGLGAILAGVMVATGAVLHPPEEAAAVGTNLWAISHVLLLLSLIFGIAAIVGLYTRQPEESGPLGLAGFLLVLVANVFFVGIVYFEAFINPEFAVLAPDVIERQMTGGLGGPLSTLIPLNGLAFSLGWLLFGIATARAGVLPRWAAILVVVGGVPFGVAPGLVPALVGKIAAVVFGLGVIGLGHALWSVKTPTCMEGNLQRQSQQGF